MANGTTIGRDAVVIGASMGGLLAARVLSERFERVTIVERDALPGACATRKGVPQARHAHGLLATGYDALRSLFPGLAERLVAAGGIEGDLGVDCTWCHGGVRHASHESGLRGILVSRPRLELEVLARVRALPNVRILERTDALGLVFVDGGARVAGLRTLGRAAGAAEESLAADLVVDASGRGSRVPAWLAAAGWPAPVEETIGIDLRYTTRLYRRREGSGVPNAVIVSATRGFPRGGAALAMEGGRFIVTGGGYAGEEPPGDVEGFERWLGTFAAPDLQALVRASDPLPGDAAHHRTPASVRRRYERLRRFPEGLLVTADALCAFNPIYGQGMTVAALEALALRGLLAGGSRRLAPRFFRAAAKAVDMAWDTAAVNDLQLDGVAGRRTPRVRFVNWYLAKLHVAARTDPEVAGAFLRVANLLAPPQAILRPRIAWRVLRAHLARRPAAVRPAPAGAEAARREQAA